jgi:glycosyltransferase involved in cell wall biosynthesis
MSWFKYLHPRVDKIICLTDAVKKNIDKNLFFDNSKTVIIKKGHSPEWYRNVDQAERSELNIPSDAFVVSVVSNVRKFKRIPDYIRSSYHLPKDLPIHFLMIGKNMDKPALKKLIDKSSYKNNFHLPGFINDPLPWIAASDVIVLASAGGEGINKTVVEAMSLGIPAIITNIENNKDLFVRNADELLVPVRNPRAIADAIITLYKNPNEKRNLGKDQKNM